MTRLDRSSPYRYVCPRGHHTVRENTNGLRCHTCGNNGHGSDVPFLMDKKTDRKVTV